MKNELHERLLKLSQDFQIEITKSLSPSTHRLIRENFIISSKNTQIFNANIFKEAENLEME